MSETADLNDSTESLFTVFRGRLFQFRIVRGKNDCCLSCKRVGGIWYESECMFRENLNGGSIRGIKFVYNFYPSGIKYLRNFIHCVKIISFPKFHKDIIS